MSLNDIAKRLRRKKLINSSILAFVSLMMSELVEEILEESIAFGITWLFAKAVSSIGIICLVQFIKVFGKKTIKKITYKEGNDKMQKVKQFFSVLGQGIWANKFSLLGTISAVLTALAGVDVVNVNALPAIVVFGANITPVLYYCLFGVLSLFGISKKGWETIKQYFDRVAKEKAEKDAEKENKATQKEEAKLVKLAKKEIAKEQKELAHSEAEKVAEQEKAKSNEEKQKLDAEKRAKIDAIKADIKSKENK